MRQVMSKLRRKTSMQDIADHLGISKNAVSLAINDKPGVSEELKKMVFKTAEDLNYSGLGKISRKPGNNILVLIPEYIRNDTYFYNQIYWTIEKEAKIHGYNAILSSISPEMENNLQLPNLYYDLDIIGIMIIGVFNIEYVKKLLGTKLQVLSVDHFYDELSLDAIVTANEEGAFKAVKYLIDNGHRDIGYVGAIHMTASLYERWSGFNKAMLYHGLKINEEHCILNTSPLSVLFADPEELGKYVDRMDSFPTAWFCGGDRIAISLMEVLAKRNINVPEEISIIGFDDIDASRIVNPALTTLKVKREAMGKEAVDFFIRKIGNNDGEKKKISIYGEMILRNSAKSI